MTHSPDHAERAEVMRLARTAFAMEVSMIERDARISELTDDETDSIIDGVLAAARAAALRGRDVEVEDPPHHTSISLDAAMKAVRTGDTHQWSGAIYDHLRNYAALRASLHDDSVRGEGE
jgi:hypothetical protein